MRPDDLFVGLGPCPQAALEWCVKNAILRREQVLGSFFRPSNNGGSTTKFYLDEVTLSLAQCQRPSSPPYRMA